MVGDIVGFGVDFRGILLVRLRGGSVKGAVTVDDSCKSTADGSVGLEALVVLDADVGAVGQIAADDFSGVLGDNCASIARPADLAFEVPVEEVNEVDSFDGREVHVVEDDSVVSSSLELFETVEVRDDEWVVKLGASPLGFSDTGWSPDVEDTPVEGCVKVPNCVWVFVDEIVGFSHVASDDS